MKEISIRAARLEDALAIAELSGQLGYPTSSEQAESRLGRLLALKDHAVYLASLPDKTVVGWIHGFLAYRVESDGFVEIGGLVVSNQCRRKGVGKKLVSAIEKWGRGLDVGELRVRTRTERLDAQAFYAQIGFVSSKSQFVLCKSLENLTK